MLDIALPPAALDVEFPKFWREFNAGLAARGRYPADAETACKYHAAGFRPAEAAMLAAPFADGPTWTSEPTDADRTIDLSDCDTAERFAHLFSGELR